MLLEPLAGFVGGYVFGENTNFRHSFSLAFNVTWLLLPKQE
jgi:hypothetical protein